MKYGVEVRQKKLDIESNIGVVILARFSSSRLPGKALIEIKSKPVLLYIIERIQQILTKDRIIIATSKENSDDAIAVFANNIGIKIHRGSLNNVAERFYEAAKLLKSGYVCRINGDNIFLDSELLREMCKKACYGHYNFISNVKGRTYPKGMSVEIVDLKYYEKLLSIITNKKYYSEHVMVYLYEIPDNTHFYIKNVSLPEASGLQLALDTPEDLNRCKWIIEHLNIPHYDAGMREILNLNKQYEKNFKR